MDFTIIRQSLIDEANTSPDMLSDLAGLETYISESYNNRSFIELLQNADDANSTRFLICRIGNYLLVANDGRIFDERDLISLCRSASSGKERGHTIGYRGIGFKSVVNIANEIHIVSGEMKVTFSRELTKSVVKKATRVPLIRIPHEIRENILCEIEPNISKLKNEGYTTFFVFTGLVVEEIEDDYKNLNNLSLLFLHNIREIKNELIEMVVKIRSRTFDKGCEVDMFDSKKLLSSWVLYKTIGVTIAFLKEDNLVKKLPRAESLVYSFLPTEETTGFGALVNSDFTTDPSRRHLIKDDMTKNNIQKICELYKEIFIDNIFKDVVESQNIIKSLIPDSEPSLMQLGGSHFEKLFIEEIRKILKLTDVILRPSWLNARDFNLIVKRMNWKGVNIETGNAVLTTYLKYLGAKELLLDDIDSVELINSLDLTFAGSVQIASKFIKQSVFNVETPKSNLINLKLFYSGNKKKTLLEIDSADASIDKFYVESIMETGVTKNDFKSIFMKNNLLNLILHLNEANVVETANATPQFMDSKDKIDNESNFGMLKENWDAVKGDWWYGSTLEDMGGSELANAPKWRAVEQQVLYVLNQHGFHLKDVSRQNLGYDLEGLDPYGSIVSIEVKSVSYPGQSFKMTNNEYAVAQIKGNSFFVAIACLMGGTLQLALYPNPTKRLKFERQCVQWVWECSDYVYQPRVFEI